MNPSDWKLWLPLVRRIRRGEHPTTAVLAVAVRAEGIPDDERIREYVAGRLDGTIHVPPGKPQPPQVERDADRNGRLVSIAMRVYMLRAKYEIEGARGPHARALEAASKMWPYKTVDSIKNDLKAAKKRGLIRDFVEPIVAQYKADLLSRTQGPANPD